MNRVTEKDLKAIIKRLNEATGANVEHYTDGVPSPFNYHLSCAYGGYALHQFGETGSGVRDVFSSGHTTKRDLYNRISAYLEGMQNC